MTKELVVEVFVPTEKGGTLGRAATGYPVKDGLILTAGHVLQDHVADAGTDWPDENPVVLVTWRISPKREEWVVTEAEPVWWSLADTTDAALLQTGFPDIPGGIAHWFPLEPDLPPPGSSWTSLGFPDGTNRAMERGAFSMYGTLARAPHDSHFDLTVDVEFKDADDWRGISGAPVFHNAAVVGLIRSTEKKAAKRLHAVTVSELLKIDGFFDNLDISPTLRRKLKRRREDAEQKLTGILNRESGDVPDLLSALADEFGVDPELNPVAAVTRRLLGDLDPVLECLNEIRDRVPPSTQTLLRSILEEILPLIYPRAVVLGLDHAIRSPRHPIVAVPIGHARAVSVAMAALEGYRLDLARIDDPWIRSIATGRTESPSEQNDALAVLQDMKGPEPGMDSSVRSEVISILASLAADPQLDRMASSEHDMHLATSAKRLERFADHFNLHLEAIRRTTKVRFFYPFVADTESDGSVRREALEFLGKHVPELSLVQMSGDDLHAVGRDKFVNRTIMAFLKQEAGLSDS